MVTGGNETLGTVRVVALNGPFSGGDCAASSSLSFEGCGEQPAMHLESRRSAGRKAEDQQNDGNACNPASLCITDLIPASRLQG
jgi:hypothetical protein